MRSLLLPSDALREVEALWRRASRPGETAELYLHGVQSLSINVDPASGLLQESGGGGNHATVRLWTPEGCGKAAGWWQEGEELEELLQAARSAVSRGGAAPPVPAAPEPLPAAAPPAGGLRVDIARALASRWSQELEPLGTCIQALLIQQSLGWCGVYHSSGASAHDWRVQAQALVRCDTPDGALVDGVAAPRLDEALDPSPATARLRVALEALPGAPAELDASLPLVLRPGVAGPLVSGLAWALRGDVVASSPGLARAVGKKLFPSVLTALDDPRHPEGTVHRLMDEEGLRARPVTAVQAGQLLGFFHSRESAARLGMAPTGHALRAQGAAPAPGNFNFHVAPGNGSLPADRTELTSRLETFTTMRRPGVVSLLASGWEYRRGERHRRVGPLALELPVIPTFRQLQAVGSDLTFLPGSDGCGTPTLILSPPTWLGDSRSQ
jgi:hypothetical protein